MTDKVDSFLDYMQKCMETHYQRALQAKEDLPALKAAMEAAGEKYDRLYWKVRHHRDAERPESSRANAMPPAMRDKLDAAKQRLRGVNTDTALLEKRRDKALREYITARNKYLTATKYAARLDAGEFQKLVNREMMKRIQTGW